MEQTPNNPSWEETYNPTTVTHININGKYRIVIERAASTRGIDGFKVEANGDMIEQVQGDIEKLYAHAQATTMTAKTEA